MSTTTLYRYEGTDATGGHMLLPVNGGPTRILGGNTPDPDPDPDPPPPTPASWQAAIDSHDIVQVTLWYEAHTGHDGINPNDPNDTPLSIDDLTWVEGGIKSTHDGQVFEGLHSNHIRIRHNNVTVRRCRVTNGALYGAYYNPNFGSSITGTVIEFCTFDLPTNATAPILMAPGVTSSRSALIRHCEQFGGDSGVKGRNWVETEYCFIHDQMHPDGVHSTAISLSGHHGRTFRNLCTDGTSATINLYGDLSRGGALDIEHRENIIGGTIHMPGGRVYSPEASASYAFKMGASDSNPTDIRVIDNWFYGGYQYGLFSGNINWGTEGNIRTGNRALIDFIVQPDSPANRAEYTAGQLLPFNDE